MATTCKQAITNFQSNALRNPPSAGEIKPAEECEKVLLYFQTPPIVKLDPAALATLQACEHLALSSNAIEKLVNLSGMNNLKSLSIGRNKIKKLEHLDAIGDRLEQLWMSYNNVSSFAGIEQCGVLRCLYAGNNMVKDKKELTRLQVLPKLEELVLVGNPVQTTFEHEHGGPLVWAESVLGLLPNLRRYDGIAAVAWRQKIVEGNEEQLRALFDLIDADGSGDLDLQEVEAALKDPDIRSNAWISAEKAHSAPQFFVEMDEDNSGSIDWDEFKAFFSTRRKPSAELLGVG